jgi:hypothetical protein
MKLLDANLCLEPDCQEIFEGKFCPSCTNGASMPLGQYLNRIPYGETRIDPDIIRKARKKHDNQSQNRGSEAGQPDRQG